MKRRFFLVLKTIFLLLFLILIRTIIRAIIWDYYNVYDSVLFSSIEVFKYSLFFNLYEVPGIIAYFLLFLILQWLVKKYGKLTLWRQVLISILIVFPIARFWYLYDLRFILNANKYSWAEIFGAQLGTVFQFFTYLLFSIIFAVSQFYLIEKKHQASYYS